MRFKPVRDIIFAHKTPLSVRIIQTVFQLTALPIQNDVITLKLPRQPGGYTNVVRQDEFTHLQWLANGIHQRLRLFGIHYPVRDRKTHQQGQPGRAKRRQPPALRIFKGKPAHRGPDQKRHHGTEDFVQFDRCPDRMFSKPPWRYHQRRQHAKHAKRDIDPTVNT